jgi:hypothetical protein
LTLRSAFDPYSRSLSGLVFCGLGYLLTLAAESSAQARAAPQCLRPRAARASRLAAGCALTRRRREASAPSLHAHGAAHCASGDAGHGGAAAGGGGFAAAALLAALTLHAGVEARGSGASR